MPRVEQVLHRYQFFSSLYLSIFSPLKTKHRKKGIAEVLHTIHYPKENAINLVVFPACPLNRSIQDY